MSGSAPSRRRRAGAGHDRAVAAAPSPGVHGRGGLQKSRTYEMTANKTTRSTVAYLSGTGLGAPAGVEQRPVARLAVPDADNKRASARAAGRAIPNRGLARPMT